MFRPGAGEARTSKKGTFVMSEISGEQPALLEGWLLRESTYVSHVVNRCALHCTIPCSSMASCSQQSCPGNPRIRSAHQPHRRIRAPSAWNLIHRIWIQLRLSLSVLALLAVYIIVTRMQAIRHTSPERARHAPPEKRPVYRQVVAPEQQLASRPARQEDVQQSEGWR